MSVCHQTSCKSLLLLLQFFFWFSRNLAHVICVPVWKNCGTDFRNFDFKNFYQIFQHFKFGLVCGTVAVELSMMTGLSSYTLQQLGWCQLNATCLFIVHLVHCTSCTLVSRCLHGTAPPYLADQLQPVAALESRRRLRSSASARQDIPRARRTTIGDRAFCVAGPRVWISLSSSTQSAPSLLVFRRLLKCELFHRCYDLC